MNVVAQQDLEKNEETKKGKSEAGERRRQATDFREAVCCPSAVVRRAAQRKNGLCEGSARGNWDPREDQKPFQPKRVGDRTTSLRRLLIGAVKRALRFFSGTELLNFDYNI